MIINTVSVLVLIFGIMTVTRIETKKKVNQLREQGQIPAVLYGHKVKSKNLSLYRKNKRGKGV